MSYPIQKPPFVLFAPIDERCQSTTPVDWRILETNQKRSQSDTSIEKDEESKKQRVDESERASSVVPSVLSSALTPSGFGFLFPMAKDLIESMSDL